jgi:serine protease Do
MLAAAMLALTCARANTGCAATPQDTTAAEGRRGGAERAGAPLPPPEPSRNAQIARIVTPAVVSIEAEFAPEAVAQQQGEAPFPPELIPPGLEPGPRGPVRASGSGVLVRPDGYSLTNNHVVAGAERVNVTLLDRRIFPAKIIGRDPSTDVAVIKIDGTGFPSVQLGADSAAQVGDPVLAIGNPLGLDFTVTAGIISAKGRGGALRSLFPTDYAVADFLQTDAPINPGNSGGPLVDMQARVIGINSAIASPTGMYTGYGFAIPISIARIVMDEILRYGHARHAILGIAVQDVGPTDARAAGLEQIRGVLVGGYASDDSPAKRSGLRPGDVILSLDGRPVSDVSELQRMLLGYQPGQTVTLRVMRYGTEQTVRLTLGEAPVPAGMVAGPAGGGAGAERSASRRLGVQVAPVTADVAAQLELPQGVRGLVVAAVDPRGPAVGRLVPSDVITARIVAGGERPVRSVQDLEQAITEARNGVVSLLVYSPQARGTRVVNIPVQP